MSTPRVGRIWSRVVQGWERLRVRVLPGVDFDPFRREREASDEDTRQRQEWRSKLNEIAESITAMPPVPSESGEAQAHRMQAAMVTQMGLRDPDNPQAVKVVLHYYRSHYRKELHALVPRRRGESRQTYTARQETAVKEVMREGIRDGLLWDAMTAYVDGPSRLSWDDIPVLLDGFIRWLNWQGVFGLALVFIFVWAGPQVAAWINTGGKALFHSDGIGHGSWATLLFLILMIPVMVWIYGGWSALRQWVKRAGRT